MNEVAPVRVTVQMPLAPRLPLTFWISTRSPVLIPVSITFPQVIEIGEALVASVMVRAAARVTASSIRFQTAPPLADQVTVTLDSAGSGAGLAAAT